MQIKKPWGHYHDIERTEDYVLKIISVKPKQRLSLQYHDNRAEFWVVMEGTPLIEVGDEVRRLRHLDAVRIDTREPHRLINDTNKFVVILELQYGSCNEDDIVRLEDDYGRIR